MPKPTTRGAIFVALLIDILFIIESKTKVTTVKITAPKRADITAFIGDIKHPTHGKIPKINAAYKGIRV